MRKKIIIIIFLSGIIIIIFFLFFYNKGDNGFTPSDSLPIPENISNFFKNKSAALPLEAIKVPASARLLIPSLHIDAAVESVGLTSVGAMEVPKGPEGVAWFKFGPLPGDKGSAVIDGHSGWKNNLPAVFDNIHKLQKGDKIFYEDKAGVTVTFVVRELRNYDPTADATDIFISTDKQAHLNLITCEGVWDPVTKSHSQRLVVFTDKEIK